MYDFLESDDIGTSGGGNAAQYGDWKNLAKKAAARRKTLIPGSALGGEGAFEGVTDAEAQPASYLGSGATADVSRTPSDDPQQAVSEATMAKLAPAAAAVAGGFGTDSPTRAVQKITQRVDSQTPVNSQEGLTDGTPDRQSGSGSFTHGGIDRTKSDAIRAAIRQLDESNNSTWGKLGRAIGGSGNYHRERAMLLEQLNQEGAREERDFALTHPQVLKEYVTPEGTRMREMFDPASGRTWSTEIGKQLVAPKGFKAGETIVQPGQEDRVAKGVIGPRGSAPATMIDEQGNAVAAAGTGAPTKKTAVFDVDGRYVRTVEGGATTVGRRPTGGGALSQNVQAQKLQADILKSQATLIGNQQKQHRANLMAKAQDPAAWQEADDAYAAKLDEIRAQQKELAASVGGAPPLRQRLTGGKANGSDLQPTGKTIKGRAVFVKGNQYVWEDGSPVTSAAAKG